MNTPKSISEKVEATLASADGISRATANPFLYTRVLSRLKAEESTEWSWAARFLSRPAIALATVMLVVLVNGVVLFRSSQPVTPIQEDEQIFASEYNYPQTTADRFYSVNEEQQ